MMYSKDRGKKFGGGRGLRGRGRLGEVENTINLGRGRGGGNRPGSGPGGNCVCPNCGEKIAHIAGQQCFNQQCPKCGANMIKE